MNASTQSLENMPADTLSTSTLTRLAANDYVRNLPDDFWSPVFGQPNHRDEAYEFNFDQWQAHYQERKRVMQHFIEDWLRHGGTILESFSDDRPTTDFTEAYRNGCCDTLWNLKGTRRMDIHGTISNYSRPFIDKAMTPAYLANHLASRLFAFNMRFATWLEPPLCFRR
jgi:hypothetical protein